MASSGPETIAQAGALTAASAKCCRAALPPAPRLPDREHRTRGCACISRARSATTRNASSGDKHAAIVAATYSPRLWPNHRRRLDAPLIQSRASACSMTQHRGCVKFVWFRICGARLASSAAGNSTSRRSRPSNGVEHRTSAIHLGAKTPAPAHKVPRHVDRLGPCRETGTSTPSPAASRSRDQSRLSFLAQFFDRIAHAVAHQNDAMPESLASGLQRERHVGERTVRIALEMRCEPLGHRIARRRRPRRPDSSCFAVTRSSLTSGASSIAT
jgi:hypothetical protein